MYVKQSAERGFLEKVVIKKANLVGWSGKVPDYNYVDTFNEVWLPWELVNYSQALLILDDRNQRLREQLNVALGQTGCLVQTGQKCEADIVGNP